MAFTVKYLADLQKDRELKAATHTCKTKEEHEMSQRFLSMMLSGKVIDIGKLYREKN